MPVIKEHSFEMKSIGDQPINRMVLMWSKSHGFVVANKPKGCCAGIWRKVGDVWCGSGNISAMYATHFMDLPEITD